MNIISQSTFNLCTMEDNKEKKEMMFHKYWKDLFKIYIRNIN